jgi:hypothetical protein
MLRSKTRTSSGSSEGALPDAGRVLRGAAGANPERARARSR